MIRVEDAAVLLSLDADVLRRWMSDGLIHGCVTEVGQWLICAGSMRGLG